MFTWLVSRSQKSGKLDKVRKLEIQSRWPSFQSPQKFPSEPFPRVRYPSSTWEDMEWNLSIWSICRCWGFWKFQFSSFCPQRFKPQIPFQSGREKKKGRKKNRITKFRSLWIGFLPRIFTECIPFPIISWTICHASKQRTNVQMTPVTAFLYL